MEQQPNKLKITRNRKNSLNPKSSSSTLESNTFKREILESVHGDLLHKLPQLISNPILLQIIGVNVGLRSGRVDEIGNGSGGGRNLSGDLIGALESLGGELFGALGGLGDDVGEVGGGNCLPELLRFLGRFLRKGASSVPDIHGRSEIAENKSGLSLSLSFSLSAI